MKEPSFFDDLFYNFLGNGISSWLWIGIFFIIVVPTILGLSITLTESNLVAGLLTLLSFIGGILFMVYWMMKKAKEEEEYPRKDNKKGK